MFVDFFTRLARILPLVVFLSAIVGYAQNIAVTPAATTTLSWQERRNIIEKAIALIQSQNSVKLTISRFALAANGLTTLGDYQLYRLTYTAYLPMPNWIIAKNNRDPQATLLQLTPDNRENWNRLMDGAKLNLNSKAETARFPVTFLKATAPWEKPQWRFSNEEMNRVGAEASQLLKAGWNYKQLENQLELNFLSTDPLGNFSHWHMTIQPDGKILSLEHRKLD